MSSGSFLPEKRAANAIIQRDLINSVIKNVERVLPLHE
jgi:hypothetical protein